MSDSVGMGITSGEMIAHGGGGRKGQNSTADFIALFVALFCFRSETPVSDMKQNGQKWKPETGVLMALFVGYNQNHPGCLPRVEISWWS